MTRKEFLAQYQTKEWYELSRQIKARDHNTCQMCGRNDVPLSVHHLQYGKDGSIFDIGAFTLITLCDNCHKLIHLYRNNIDNIINLSRGFMTDYEIYAILASEFGRIDYLLNPNGIKVSEKSINMPTLVLNPIDTEIDFLGNLRKHNNDIIRQILIKNGRYIKDK